MNLLPPILVILLYALPAWSWGYLGHRTSALLASRFLRRPAARNIRQLLKPTSLVSAATWADNYSHSPEGRYSAGWHYIDAKDDPPTRCEINYSRDCSKDSGCIISAIKNHTARAVDLSVEWEERQKSLKWVIHFLADVHQPLHTEDLLKGGNGIEVLWHGHPRNLHSVWDSAIAEKMRGGKSIRHAVEWATELEMLIKGGKWGDEVEVMEKWGQCLDLETPEDCAVHWAEGANQWVCDYVLPKDYPEGLNGTELSEGYYEGAIEIVERQMAMAGWRMAQWLNKMFDPLSEHGLRDETPSIVENALEQVKEFFGFGWEL